MLAKEGREDTNEEQEDDDNDNGYETDNDDDYPTDCCMNYILSLQSDFKNEKCLIE